MPASFKPVTFDRHGRARRRATVPRWLVLLGVGMAVGVGGVVYVQEELLPPRLSYDASTRLRQGYERAEAERQRLTSELAETGRQLEAALSKAGSLETQLAESRRSVEALRADVAALVEALPPDPRGGAVAVRAWRFETAADALAYDVLLTRNATGGRPLSGHVQVAVRGRNGRGTETTVALPPVTVSIGTHGSASGRAPLPPGFTPDQATVRITDGPDGALLGQRVVYVR